MPDKTTPHIEKAARPICHYREPSDFNSCCPEPMGEKRCQRHARLVLSTTLEPSEAEIEHGAQAIYAASIEAMSDEEPHPESWPTLIEAQKDFARMMARAALIAAARVRLGE